MENWQGVQSACEYECTICGADLSPSEAYPWHWPDEDCRAIREPLNGHMLGIAQPMATGKD